MFILLFFSSLYLFTNNLEYNTSSENYYLGYGNTNNIPYFNPINNNTLNKYLGYINYSSYKEPDHMTIETLSRYIINNSNSLHNTYLLPDIIDYRNYNNTNYITSIKYQYSCGSCVAFAAISVIEAQYKLIGYTLDLSEKDLFFCKGRRNCNNGWYLYDVSRILIDNKISEEKNCPYFEYMYTCTSTCHNNRLFGIKNYYYIDTFYSMKLWLYKQGPLLTRMNVYKDFFSYKRGIYKKSSNQFVGGHAVAVIGYNDIEEYWICKNSWGRYWGENGFFRIKYGESGIMPFAYGYEIDSNISNIIDTNYYTNKNPNIILIFITFIILLL